MQKIFLIILIVPVLYSCHKGNTVTPGIPPPSHPVMQYRDLLNTEVKFGDFYRLDINNDGSIDFAFSTLLVGDPILQRDRKQYYAVSGANTCLLNDSEDQSPVLIKNESISSPYDGYQWFEVSAIVLAEKIVPVTGSSFWQGLWLQATHRYLPVKVKKNDAFYHGWIELTFDMNEEKIILHKTGICTVAGVTIKAGL